MLYLLRKAVRDVHIAIITEYNPFHMGHGYQITEIKKAFPDACVTAIMGGIFSQRGEAYITTPYVRAEAAVRCGANLVIELPFPFSCAPAKIFARAGVEIAEKIGADMLVFGSECGSIDLLSKTLERLESDEMKTAVQEYDDGSISKMRAYSLAYKKLFGEESPDMPNDILGIEYLRAIKSRGFKITPYTIKRVGDYKGGKSGFASASLLRTIYKKEGIDAITCGIPTAAYEVYGNAHKNGLFGTNFEKLSGAVMLEFAKSNTDIAFSGGGLYNYIQKQAASATKIKDLLDAAPTSRYTLSEIARCILYTLLGVKSPEFDDDVHYTRLFAADSKGRETLKNITAIELITKPSATHLLSEKALSQYKRTFLAERAFAMCFDGIYEFTKQTPKVIS